jgi:hypothetical protein
LTDVTTTNSKPYGDAHRACRNTIEREQLASVLRARWPATALHEYARLHFFKNGKDHPTATSYRRAIADIASGASYPRTWLKSFRKRGSKPLPPRREGLLQRGRGLGDHRVTDEEYAWSGHTEEYRSMIEQRCRDYWKHIPPEKPVHVNAWAASQRWHRREQNDLRSAAGWPLHSLLPKALKKSPPKGYKLVYPSSYFGFFLPPHFSRDFKDHTAQFREEVDALARKDNRLQPKAPVGRKRWSIACQKHFVLIQRTQA